MLGLWQEPTLVPCRLPHLQSVQDRGGVSGSLGQGVPVVLGFSKVGPLTLVEVHWDKGSKDNRITRANITNIARVGANLKFCGDGFEVPGKLPFGRGKLSKI